MRRLLILMTCVLPLPAAPVALAEEPTFSREVAGIIHSKCTTCHRPGSSAPFSLITFRDVQQRAATIDAVLANNYMPPWKPVDHGIAFANSRGLSPQQKRTVQRWIAAGCPEGDPRETPAPQPFSDGWSLGPPDLVIRMQGQFEVPADGPDIYRSFVFPVNLPQDKWVKAVELRPTATSAVHHAIFFVDSTGNARRLDGADGQAGLTGMGFLADFGGTSEADTPGGSRTPRNRLRDSRLLQRFRKAAPKEQDTATQGTRALRSLGGYVPGSTPNRLPGDLAMPLPKGSDIVMQTHFHPSGKVETEQAELALYFADRPPSRRIVPVMVPPMFGFGAGIRVPAGQANYRVTDSITLPVDTLAVGVTGHAHYICREMRLTGTLPDGRTAVLLHINDWDLDWQDQYLFERPLELPAGTTLRAEITYDNSADNPRNPHSPPRDISWGRGSTDEMGSMTLTTIAKQQADEGALEAGVQRHIVAQLVNRQSGDLAEMLMQLDDDGDGKLLGAEIPPRMNDRAIRLIDTNNDGGLDRDEITRALRLRDQLRGGRSR